MSAEHEEHIVPKSLYYAIFAALMVLTAITVAIAYVNLGAANTPIAIIIACAKATLVILFFMHVKYSDHLTWLLAAAGFVFLVIMFVFTLQDLFTREWIPIPPGLPPGL